MKLIEFSDQELDLLRALLAAEENSVQFYDPESADIFFSMRDKVGVTHDPARP